MTKTLFLSGIALLIAVIAVEDQCERDGKDIGATSHPVPSTIYQYSAVHDAKTKRKCSISGEPYTNQAQNLESAAWYWNLYPDAVLVHTGPGTIICDDINWSHD